MAELRKCCEHYLSLDYRRLSPSECPDCGNLLMVRDGKWQVERERPEPAEQLAEANKLLHQWLEWFNMRPGKLFMAPSGITRMHLTKSTEMFRREAEST